MEMLIAGVFTLAVGNTVIEKPFEVTYIVSQCDHAQAADSMKRVTEIINVDSFGKVIVKNVEYEVTCE